MLPVIPGSLIIALAVLVWAVDSGSWAWAVFAVVAALLAAGWLASYIVTGRRVLAAGVPRSSIIVAGLLGIVGFFVIPLLGLFVGFALGLFAMEYRRFGDRAAAWASAWVAIKATALGMLIELALASSAAATWLIAVLVGVGR